MRLGLTEIKLSVPVENDEDYKKARDIFNFLCPNSEFFHYFVIEGEPYSKARPRFSKGRVYSTQKQKNNEQYIALNLRTRIEKPLTHNLAIGCIFYRSTNQRIDVDNMLKNVMDAANGIIYVDDCQVTAKVGIAELDSERPRTVIIVGRHESSLVRDMSKDMICKTCKKEYDVRSPYWNKKSKYCSRECASLSRGESLKSLVKCPKCNVEFRRRTAAQRYCSEDCRKQIMADRNRGKRVHPHPKCNTCGGKVSRPEYVRCRKCWSSRG